MAELFTDLGIYPWAALLLASIIKVTLILVGGSVGMMLLTWVERRGIAYMQDRRGPNRVGPQGLLQPISEAIKTMTKEDITPYAADRVVHFLAPVVMLGATVLTFAVLPWGNLFPVDLNVGILFVFAVTGLHTIGMLMAGWGSNNKFALLGGMRGVAQMISYEIPLLMALLPVILLSGSLSIQDIVERQADWFGMGWYIFSPVGLFGFITFFIAALAEGERTPFDIPEADSEIVAGYLTEYGGMKFAIFYLSNYMTNLALCFITTSLYLGGGNGPGVYELGGFAGDLLSLVYFLIKALALFFFMVLIRATVPRLRIDQLMGFAWKFLLPLVLINIFNTAIWVSITRWTEFNNTLGEPAGDNYLRYGIAFAVTTVIAVLAFALVYFINRRQSKPATLTEEEAALGLAG